MRQNTNALYFLTRRCWRIFPLYWIVLAFSVSINAFGLAAASWMPVHPPLDYILLLSTENRYLPQAWSLVFELYFYASVAFVLLVSPKGWFFRTLALWLLMETVLIALCGPDGAPPVNMLSLEFGLGCVVAWLNARNLIRCELIAWTFGILLFAGGEWWFVQIAPITSVSRFFTFGIGAALSLYALVGLERRGACLFPKIVQRLGDASYSLYLWHIPLLIVAMTLGIRNGTALCLVFSAAFASYYFIEAPLLRLHAPKLWERLRGFLRTASTRESQSQPGTLRPASTGIASIA
jgi:peptidoglycan/LPS O-acetylase OafA/YrhL